MTLVGRLLDSTTTLLAIGLVAVLVMAALAPLEALGWWAGWWGREAYTPVRNRPPQAPGDEAAVERPEHFVVYLSGLGSASKEWRFPEEAAFATRLQARLGRAVVIDDVFAYAVTIRDLGEARLSHRRWQAVRAARLTNPDTMLGWLIMARNAFRMGVSVDHRYGPFFNLSNAETIREALLAHSYELGSGQRVTLIGYSHGSDPLPDGTPRVEYTLALVADLITAESPKR